MFRFNFGSEPSVQPVIAVPAASPAGYVYDHGAVGVLPSALEPVLLPVHGSCPHCARLTLRRLPAACAAGTSLDPVVGKLDLLPGVYEGAWIGLLESTRRLSRLWLPTLALRRFRWF